MTAYEKITIWTKDNCIYCVRAKKLLESKNMKFQEHKIGDGYTKEQLLEAVPTARTVPQIFINDEYIGGYQELARYLLEKEK